jgi:hypothetical protein
MSHRCHWYENEVGLPVHVPSFAVSDSPTCGVPEIVGRAVFRGPSADVTTAVGSERADAAPSALTAVTRTRIVLPASAAVSRYVLRAARKMLRQSLPLASQRCHWYWNVVGLFVHEPF